MRVIVAGRFRQQVQGDEASPQVRRRRGEPSGGRLLGGSARAAGVEQGLDVLLGGPGVLEGDLAEAQAPAPASGVEELDRAVSVLVG
jgi:hypothetical protein